LNGFLDGELFLLFGLGVLVDYVAGIDVLAVDA
jgi:hypothetical protein